MASASLSLVAQMAARKRAEMKDLDEASMATITATAAAQAVARRQQRSDDDDTAAAADAGANLVEECRATLAAQVKALLKWQRSADEPTTSAVVISVPGHAGPAVAPSEAFFVAVVCDVALADADASRDLPAGALDEVCPGLLQELCAGAGLPVRAATAAGAGSAEWRAWVQHLARVAAGSSSEARPAGAVGAVLPEPSADSVAAIAEAASVLGEASRAATTTTAAGTEPSAKAHRVEASDDGEGNSTAAAAAAESSVKQEGASAVKKEPGEPEGEQGSSGASREFVGELTLQLQRLLRWAAQREGASAVATSDAGRVVLKEDLFCVVLCTTVLALERLPSGPVPSTRLEQLGVLPAVRTLVDATRDSPKEGTNDASKGGKKNAAFESCTVGEWCELLLSVGAGRTSASEPRRPKPKAQHQKPADPAAAGASKTATGQTVTAGDKKPEQQPAAKTAGNKSQAADGATPATASPSAKGDTSKQKDDRSKPLKVSAVPLLPSDPSRLIQQDSHGVDRVRFELVAGRCRMSPQAKRNLAGFLRSATVGTADAGQIQRAFHVPPPMAYGATDCPKELALNAFRSRLPQPLETVQQLVPQARGTPIAHQQLVLLRLRVGTQRTALVACTIRGEPVVMTQPMKGKMKEVYPDLLQRFYGGHAPSAGFLASGQDFHHGFDESVLSAYPANKQLLKDVMAQALGLGTFLNSFTAKFHEGDHVDAKALERYTAMLGGLAVFYALSA